MSNKQWRRNGPNAIAEVQRTATETLPLNSQQNIGIYHWLEGSSRKHAYIILTPLKSTFIYIIFHISAQNIDCGYSLEPPRRGGSNRYPPSMFWTFIWKFLVFWRRTFSIYLNRHVFVMYIENIRPKDHCLASRGLPPLPPRPHPHPPWNCMHPV